MIKNYRKKPVVISAIQYTGEEAIFAISAFMGGVCIDRAFEPAKIVIETLEGTMTAELDDYIIKGIAGEFYPCKPDIFEKCYHEES